MATNVTQRWKHRPEGSTWGDWGPDDQIGRLNLLTAEKIKQGVAEVREGIPFCLSMPLDYPGKNVLNERRYPPILRPVIRNGKVGFLYRTDLDDPELLDTINDDAAIIHLQYSSQWDSLAHVGQMFDADGDGVPEMRFYNGWRGGVDIHGPTDVKDCGAHMDLIPGKSTSHADKLGVENMAEKCIQGRGVMIDLFAHFGNERKAVGWSDLKGILDKDKVVIEPGDIVCLRTGVDEALFRYNKNPDKEYFHTHHPALDGRDDGILQWITDTGLVALISDNSAVEYTPARKVPGKRANLPLHVHCLFKLGVYLGEYWYLSPLAEWLRKHGRNRFLITAPPLRLPGAVGSPPSPIATV